MIDTNKARELAQEVKRLGESEGFYDLPEAAALLLQLAEAHDSMADVLQRSGFVRRDIPACNCGSWHHRYGLPERMAEIKELLAESGYPLSNDNGNLAINAMQAMAKDAARYRWLRKNCVQEKPLGDQFIEFHCDFENWNDIDAAIDAAMGADNG